MEEERVDILNSKGKVIGQTTREEAIKKGEVIGAVSTFIVDKNGHILIEKRSEKAKHDAGMLDLVSGHITSGETPKEAAIREIKEELGENTFSEEELNSIREVATRRINFTEVGREGNYLVTLFLMKLDRILTREMCDLQEDEVADIEHIPYELFEYIVQTRKSNVRIPYNKTTAEAMEMVKREIFDIKPKRGNHLKKAEQESHEDSDIGDN